MGVKVVGSSVTVNSPAPVIPLLKELSFTHILQTNFVKWPWKRDAIVDYFTDSTVSILPAGSPKKMWVRISLKEGGETTLWGRYKQAIFFYPYFSISSHQ